MNKRTILRKISLLLMLIILAVLVYKVILIYAVFYSKAEINTNLKGATWTIDVNGENIATGIDKTFQIDNILTTENQHVKPGKMAPGLSGEFEITINPHNTDVSVRYDITLDKEKLKNENIKIRAIFENERGYTLVQTDKNTYTGIIPLQNIKNGEFHKIVVEVEWIDDGINNESDTIIGKDLTHKIKIPVKVHVVQYLGEEIIPYVEEQVQVN